MGHNYYLISRKLLRRKAGNRAKGSFKRLRKSLLRTFRYGERVVDGMHHIGKFSATEGYCFMWNLTPEQFQTYQVIDGDEPFTAESAEEEPGYELIGEDGLLDDWTTESFLKMALGCKEQILSYCGQTFS